MNFLLAANPYGYFDDAALIFAMAAMVAAWRWFDGD